MRIGIDATSLPRHIAGAGRYICSIIHNLAKIDLDNEYFIFVKKRDGYLFSNPPQNFSIIKLPNFPRTARIAWEITRPGYYARLLELDVWHAPHYVAPIGLNGTSLVVTIHDMTFFLFPNLYPASRRLSFRNFIRQAVRRADSLIAVSNTTRRDLLQFFPESNFKANVIYSGVDGKRNYNNGSAEAETTRRRYCGGSPFILFVGTLERRKNIPMLISAFSDLIGETSYPHHLVLVGQPGNAMRSISEAIATSEVGDRIHLTGYVDEEELARLYCGAELFVFPSLYEGFGFPVIEAMAYGIPTLCSNVSATAEIAQLPEMLFSPCHVESISAKMKHALTDENYSRKLAEYGRIRAEEFSWQRTAELTLKAYKNLVSKSKSSTVLGFEKDMELEIPTTIETETSRIREAILRTLMFSDLFDYPLSPPEIHRDLAGISPALARVKKILDNSMLGKEVESKDGYYFLKGREIVVHQRKAKREKTKSLLRRHHRSLRFICMFPFVRAAALSGTTAFENVNGNDDIDLFILVDGRRTWTTYLLLVLFMKLLKRRDLMCFNYLEGHADPVAAEQGFFVAHQIAHLLPISGNGAFERYWRANDWILRYLPNAKMRAYSPEDSLSAHRSRMIELFERILFNRLFDRIESVIYRLYTRRIRKLTCNGSLGKVRIDRHRIQLFTNDHEADIMTAFNESLTKAGLKVV